MPDTNYTPYTKTTWQDGDQITTNKMMNIENGIAALSTQVEEALGSTYGSLNDRMVNGLINTDGNVLLKGDLRIQKEHPALYFLGEESTLPLGGLYQVNDGSGNNRIVLYQRVPDSELEAFFLPVPSEHTAQTNYSILTSKNPVTIACGGTGATTAEDARANLGLDILMDRDIEATEITWDAGSTTYVNSANRSFVAYRRGKIGIISCSINLTATTTGSNYVKIGKLDERFKPPTVTYYNTVLRDTAAPAGISIDYGCDVKLRHNNTSTGFLQFTMVYPITASML